MKKKKNSVKLACMWNGHPANIDTWLPQIVIIWINIERFLWYIYNFINILIFVTVNIVYYYGQTVLFCWDFLSRVYISYEKCNETTTDYTAGTMLVLFTGVLINNWIL